MFEGSFDAAIVRTQLFGLRGATRENITLVDLDKAMETHVRDEGAEVGEDDRRRLLKKLKILARPETWFVLAGSLPRGLSVEAFREILETLVAQGARVILDSSEGALGVVRRRPVWLIKPNRDELADLSGMKADSGPEIARAAAALGGAAEVVLISAGADGCYLMEAGRAVHGHMDELPDRPINTVGCGDALLAGFLAARARGMEAVDCIRHAVGAATSACYQMRAGEIDPTQARSLAEKVRVEEVVA
jgi:1-phosphofructokinase family hexose kinase